MNNELYSFVKEALEKGIARDAIKNALSAAGWREEEIQQVLAAFAQVPFAVPVPKPKPYLQAREAFLYLISFIALYTSAFSFGSLIFSFIDRAFPDPVGFSFFSSQGLTLPLASVLVAFPLYLFMTWRLEKAAAQDPERRESRIGKWLTYLTLVVAAALMVGDLIAILTRLLGGEITIRFVLKAFAMLAITGSVFGYYLWNLQREEREKAKPGEKPKARVISVGLKLFSGFVIACVVLAAGYGFTLVGSPAQRRLIQFDERRASDLQSISFAIDAYWQRNKQLPSSFQDLGDQRYYYIQSVQDPKTGAPYEYRILGDVAYELCAVFETDSTELEHRERFPKPFSEKAWDHEIGRTCFEIEVQKASVPE